MLNLKMKLLAVGLVSVLALSGCASVEFEKYYGADKTYIGDGGSMKVVDGIEFWTSGQPNRPFKVIGFINGDIRDGIAANSMLNSSIASEAKAQKASAVILQNQGADYDTYNTYSYAPRGTGFAAGLNAWQVNSVQYKNLKVRYIAIKYID